MSISKKKDVFAFRYNNCKGSLPMGLSKWTVSDLGTLIEKAISVYLRHIRVVLGGPGEIGYPDGVCGASRRFMGEKDKVHRIFAECVANGKEI
ncbi:hypothetical protein BV898_08996 [Hypsibius exemplaris]|uniref:Uncharacterized protein n=1 Tax=Hypsibius exemplaris TaxID=2072580 RepID=A0A1W0WNX3_HYPEX|nr:hypothetical protein BV898_08996 [Hypsibius exemplaris]